MSRATPLPIRQLVRAMPDEELQALVKRLEAEIPRAQSLLDAARRALRRHRRYPTPPAVNQQDGE